METAYYKMMEKYSSAITLSDMEIFVFPELLLAGALSNIMSPVIWQWKEDPWFEGLEKLSEYRRILKVKQYIIDHFIFNLDLDTWGLTTKEKELSRFTPYIDLEALKASNALFGYEGDRYYFDIDIRRHFHLDQYTDEVIPYWKTETIEAMTAFSRRPGFQKGGGECVSFSLLYYAALFILAEIPLERLHMLATPLHSQNFVSAGGGLLTNNRRIVTQNMWFNGTETSFKARRALQNEKVTMVANIFGYVHTLYKEATMPRQNYLDFSKEFNTFLLPPADVDMFYGFLRQHSNWQKAFQFQHAGGYVAAEEVYAIEDSHASMVSMQGVDKLLSLIPPEKAVSVPMEGRAVIQELASVIKKSKGRLSFANTSSWPEFLSSACFGMTQEVIKAWCADFAGFCYIEPKLPDFEKTWLPPQFLDLRGLKNRDEIISYLQSVRRENPIADLAFMAYRDVSQGKWQPFLKAALERNPVVIDAMEEFSPQQAYRELLTLDDDSIYSENRLAQPDEVWNFHTGDGIEKAICLWNVLAARDQAAGGRLTLTDKIARLDYAGVSYDFNSKKGFAPACWDANFLLERGCMVGT